jgi:hypothetical protein
MKVKLTEQQFRRVILEEEEINPEKLPKVKVVPDSIKLKSFKPGDISIDLQIAIDNKFNIKFKVKDYDLKIYANSIPLGTTQMGAGEKWEVTRKGKGDSVHKMNIKLTNASNMGKILTSIAERSTTNKPVYYIGIKGDLKVGIGPFSKEVPLAITPLVQKFNINTWMENTLKSAEDTINKYLKDIKSNKTFQNLTKTTKDVSKKVYNKVKNVATDIYNMWE